MITKLKTVALAGFATLALTGAMPSIVHAQPAPMQQGPGNHRPHPDQNLDQRIDAVLMRVSATADQKAKIHGIADAAKADLAPLHAAMRDYHKQMRMLLSAPQIDTAAIETLRAQNVQTMDKMSQRVTKALVDAANILTPEQRAKLPPMGMGPHRGPNHQE
jgi:Spy/CpxP family protein refolding chaperone